MGTWFDEHSAITAFILFFSCTNIDVMFVLFSGAFGGRESFMMPISKLSKSSINYYGIPQHLLEDLPQLILQLVKKNKKIGIKKWS